MSSKTSAIFPIVQALAAAREFAQAESDWLTRNKNPEHLREQERYVPLLSSLTSETSLFSAEELKCIASLDADAINQWLEENGFNIKLKPFTDPDDFGTASIMSVLVKWKTPGVEYYGIQLDGKEVAGAKVEDDVAFSQKDGYEHPIASIACDNGDVVYMTVADRSDLSGLDLLEKVKDLSTNLASSYEYGAVCFPKVDLDQEVDISHFLGMGFSGTGPTGQKGRVTIKEAKQQTKFKMNHLGAKAESAAAFGFALECCFMPKPDMIIDKPFYVWMTRPGLSQPYFAGYIDTSDWKDPGEIK